MRPIFLFVFLSVIACLTPAQQGDRPGEVQQIRVPPEKIPPAPPLSPEEALKSFTLQDGFQIQIVASEPLIEAPVAATFDPDGRLWVLEMRGFMPNPDGVGETDPVGRVSVLEDRDSDGRMDHSTVFLDGLVMPRAFMLVRNGLLLAEPPNLWFCRDTDGDGRADERNLVANDYALEADPKLGTKANPEHSANGLLWALDNWVYSANYTTRFRNVAGLWQREPTIFRGQWGLTQDDFGRLFYNSNSDQLRGDLVPAHYLRRNPNYRPAGANVRIAQDQTVWPGRVNPGVNRGYQPNTLRPDGTLAKFTGACGPVIYRGNQFPSEFHGNAFVCEPNGNLIKRNLLIEKDGVIEAVNAYQGTEFLTSTDERFRPVNMYNGPDGALYVVDMYHGVIQHRMYLTSYLRRQYLDRGLDKPNNVGRIYRIVQKPGPTPTPKLSQAPSTELVRELQNPNGWWRDTAQQLLVERADFSVVPHLKQLAASSDNSLAQLHALWTLHGMSQLDATTVRAALNAAHPKIRATAIRLSEPWLDSNNDLFAAILKLASDPSADVQLQLAFSLGETSSPQASTTLASILHKHADHTYIRDAVISSLGGRELEFLEQILGQPQWIEPAAGLDRAIAALAQCVVSEAKPDRVQQLLTLIARKNPAQRWQQIAMLDGIISTIPKPSRGRPAPKIKSLKFETEPEALAILRAFPHQEFKERVEKIDPLFVWPGKPGVPTETETVVQLTPEQQARLQAGKELYVTTCGACHQPHGNGQEGLAPPLADSEWVTGSVARLVRITLQGARGPMTVKGKQYELEMPPLSVLTDDQIAAVLTYIRREWGHTASPVDPETVAQIRAETANREDAWTEPELLKIP